MVLISNLHFYMEILVQADGVIFMLKLHYSRIDYILRASADEGNIIISSLLLRAIKLVSLDGY